MKNKKIIYTDLFWVFMVGSVLGFFLEGIWHTMRKGFWESHTGTVWGPFCVIYGFGAVVLYVLGNRIQHKRTTTVFLMSSVAGSAAEFLAGVFQEVCFGTSSWNYSKHFLNINGKISLEMSIMWGILGAFFIKLGVPALNTVLENSKNAKTDAACVILSVFMVVNLFVTAVALVRWKYRAAGDEADNFVEKFIDENWDDEKMQKIFPNMKRV